MKTRISTKKIGSVSLRGKTSYFGSVSKNQEYKNIMIRVEQIRKLCFNLL